MHNASVTIDLSDLSAAHFSRRQVNAKARRHVESGMAASLNDLFPEFEGQALTGINEIYEKQHLRRDRACYLSSLLQRLG